jgi:hypothetical protein
VPFLDGFFTLQAFWWAARALLHVHPVDAGSWNPLLYHVWYRPAPCQGKGDHRTCLSLDTAFKHLHCTENTIYVFPEMKLRGLSPNSCIQVSVNDLRVYIPTIGLPIPLQENRWTDCGNI